MSWVTLVYPDPKPTGGLVSWQREVGRIDGLAPERRQLFCDTYLPRVRAHPQAVVRSFVEYVLSSTPRLLPQIALFCAVASAETTCFVVDDARGCAFETTPGLWRGEWLSVANPVAMAIAGRFLPLSDLLPCSSLEVALAGRPLFLPTKDTQDLVRSGIGTAGTERVRARTTQEIISQFIDEHPGEKMTVKEFLLEAKKRFPGASERSLTREFDRQKPHDWSDAGRRPGGST